MSEPAYLLDNRAEETGRRFADDDRLANKVRHGILTLLRGRGAAPGAGRRHDAAAGCSDCPGRSGRRAWRPSTPTATSPSWAALRQLEASPLISARGRRRP